MSFYTVLLLLGPAQLMVYGCAPGPKSNSGFLSARSIIVCANTLFAPISLISYGRWRVVASNLQANQLLVYSRMRLTCILS